MKYFITGTRRGLGKALKEKYGCVESLHECNIFINCKHDGFNQVRLLYEAAHHKKRIINISSNIGDGNTKTPSMYAVEKSALDKANQQLFHQGINTTSVRFGLFDTPRVSFQRGDKMSVEYCVSIIDWIITQPHRVMEISIAY